MTGIKMGTWYTLLDPNTFLKSYKSVYLSSDWNGELMIDPLMILRLKIKGIDLMDGVFK